MVKIKNIRRIKYKGNVYDITIKNQDSPYFFANDILTHNSAYPHAMFQCNLYSHCKNCTPNCNKKYSGNNMWSLRGIYCGKDSGKIETTIKNLYLLRKKYKLEKDPREFALKIILNTIYGLLGNPHFKNVYNIDSASDCTLLVREWVKLGRKMFADAGYNVIYSDTDSIFLEDKNNDLERVREIKDNIIATIKTNVPSPSETFNMSIESGITGIWFFPDETGEYKKKNYVYIINGDVKVVGLPIIKSNSSLLCKKVFDFLKPDIIKNNDIKFQKSHIAGIIEQELKKYPNIVATEFHVKAPKMYESKTCISFLIAEKYGAGRHMLIKNKRIGIGKGVKYCSLEEAKQLSLNDLDLDRIWNELAPFILKNKGLGEW